MQALDSKLSLDTAMSLYGLEHSELFWEKALDTKLLLAWNAHTIVVAFRGTASLANALADLQARGPPSPRRLWDALCGVFGVNNAHHRYSSHPSASVANTSRVLCKQQQPEGTCGAGVHLSQGSLQPT